MKQLKKRSQPGAASFFAELLRIEAEAAPKVCPKKLQLSIKSANNGVAIK